MLPFRNTSELIVLNHNVPLSYVIHTLNHQVVQWLFLIVHVAITRGVHSGAFRGSGPTIHARTMSLHRRT